MAVYKSICFRISCTASYLLQPSSRKFAVIDELWDMGLHCFDCSAGYGETALSAYLASRNRTNDAVILTKGCHPNPYRKRVASFDLLSDFHDSLAKLKRDYIDIYMLHRDDPGVPVSEIIPVLDRLKKKAESAFTELLTGQQTASGRQINLPLKMGCSLSPLSVLTTALRIRFTIHGAAASLSPDQNMLRTESGS